MSTPDSPSKSKKLLTPIKNIFNSISQSNIFNKTSPNQQKHERLPSPPPNSNPFADPVPSTNTNSNHSPNNENSNQQDEFSYEEMLSYEQHIKESEANLSPLVNFDEPLTALLNEYAEGDPVFLIKIQHLSESFPRFRRCRGDGNCFYRAFGFSLFEYLSTANAETHDTFMNVVKQTKELLIEAGFEWIAIQDFYEIFVEELEKVHPDKRNASKEQDSGQAIALTELVSTFQTDYQSNAIVVYLRFITSAFLKVNSEDYLPFIISDGYENMDQFCVSQVEAIGRESDEIHIIAICKALQLQVTVAYLDGRPNFTGGNENKDDSLMMANLYNFPDSEYKSPFLPPIYLLYRPGHYDILYSNP